MKRVTRWNASEGLKNWGNRWRKGMYWTSVFWQSQPYEC